MEPCYLITQASKSIGGKGGSAMNIQMVEKKQLPLLHLRAIKIAENFLKVEGELLEILNDVENQRVHLQMGYSSLFLYATEGLKLSESQAYNLINVMRKAREIPELKHQIQSGQLSVSKARRIVPILTAENHQEWIQKAKALPKAELEREVVKHSPSAEKKEIVRIITEQRSRMHLDLDTSLVEKLRRAQNLLRSKRRKNLTLEETLGELVDQFLERNDPLRSVNNGTGSGQGKPSRATSTRAVNGKQLGPGQVTSQAEPRANALHRPIPKPLRRQVFRRDSGRCQYKGAAGKLCNSEAYLQIHHLEPWGQGGNHTANNLMVMCEQHHRLVHDKKAESEVILHAHIPKHSLRDISAATTSKIENEAR